MGRTVADVALGFRVLAEPTDGLPVEPAVPPLPVGDPDDVDVASLTVGVCEDDGGITPSPAVRRAVREAAEAMADAGARVVAWDPVPAGEVYDLYVGLLS